MARLQVIALVALVLLVPAGTGAQILLRWDGGQASVPTVPTGVQVLRLPWAAATPDSGGAAFQLTVNDAIGALGLGRGMDLAAQAPIWGGGAWDNKEAVFDGDPATSWANPGYICASIRNGCDDIYASPGTNDIDLGARFFIERVIIRSATPLVPCVISASTWPANCRRRCGAAPPSVPWSLKSGTTVSRCARFFCRRHSGLDLCR